MIEEVQGIFPSDAALQEAIAKLTQAGIDRADLSLPIAAPNPGENTPNAGAENPDTDTDNRQIRTMNAGMATYAGAVLAGGAATLATGGIAAPVVAAIAGGAGAGVLAETALRGTDAARHEGREEAASRGELVLAVHMRAPEQLPMIERAMEEAGATRIAHVVRERPAADSASWTG